MAKKKKKLIWIIIGSVVLLIILLMAIPRREVPVTVETAKPQRKTIVEAIPANGKVQPVVEVKISPDVSGEIVELNIEEGDYVHKGQLLLKIKQDYYLSGRDRAEAQLNAVKAQLAQAEAHFAQVELSYKRNKQLYLQKTISASDFETAEAEYNSTRSQVEAARFNVKSAEAALNEAQENLIKTTIYAPMSGTVSKLSVETGERVVGTTQMAGTEMLRIANLDQMEVLVQVNENDIVRVSLHDTATIEVDAYRNKKFKGTVTQIANSAVSAGTSADQVTNFEVKVFILPESYADLKAATDYVFRPGMSAAVSIETDTRPNALCVPIQCVTTRTDIKAGSDTTSTDSTAIVPEVNINEVKEQVFVVRDNKVKAVKVTTGIQDYSHIEILDGLTDDDEVVTGPYSAISKTLNNDSPVQTKTESTQKETEK
ncbi:MAG: efflux RND transporter periplasmic adaptor subunit [Prevotellaceae bacterium]|jgi:HlyD family secretion protein|nr:efflux RND transporter periplasmic adaptor subunit [Prevotellaceae bacterium]